MKRRTLGPPAVLLLLLASVVSDPPHRLVAQQPSPNFLFGTPRMTVTLRGGYGVPDEGGDLFRFVRDNLTVSRGAFDSAVLGGELAFRLSERLDLGFGLDCARRSVGSESRDYVEVVGLDSLPIEQRNTLLRVPFTANLRAYLFPRGRAIGRLAWVPNRWSPFVGVGAGVEWYRFEQKGDFVDYQTMDIFTDRLAVSGSVPELHVMGGAEVTLNRHLSLTGELRYSWARADLGGSSGATGDFSGFDSLDLSGFRGTVGITVRGGGM